MCDYFETQVRGSFSEYTSNRHASIDILYAHAHKPGMEKTTLMLCCKEEIDQFYNRNTDS